MTLIHQLCVMCCIPMSFGGVFPPKYMSRAQRLLFFSFNLAALVTVTLWMTIRMAVVWKWRPPPDIRQMSHAMQHVAIGIPYIILNAAIVCWDKAIVDGTWRCAHVCEHVRMHTECKYCGAVAKVQAHHDMCAYMSMHMCSKTCTHLHSRLAHTGVCV